jgi:ParB family chromosome partitioning protein
METLVQLSHLVAGRDNVRRTNPLVDIPVLAALIKSQGLLQNLLVRENGDGKYRVVDGRRRRAAIKLLVESGDWPKGQLVPVKVLGAEHNDTEVGLAANIGRVNMHPADTFEAFRRRVEDEGETPEAIALRFGYAVSTVRGFLKLANVSPRLMRDFKKDEVSLEQMKALAITDNHKRQEAVFYDLPNYARQPKTLKRLLMEGRLDGGDRLVRFVGLEIYEAAGGAVTRDLFGDEGEVYVEDSGLIRRLATATLDEEAQRLRQQGWKWVEVQSESDGKDPGKYRRVSKAEHGFDPASRPAKVYAGAVVAIDGDGKLYVTTGLLKPEDARALARASAQDETSATGSPDASAENPGIQYPAQLVEKLTAIRTAALRAEVARRPDVALTIIVHELALAAFYNRWEAEPLTEIEAKFLDIASLTKDSGANAAIVQAETTTRKLADRLPKSPSALWQWLLGKSQGELLALLAPCLAGSINAVQYRAEKRTPARVRAGDRLVQTLDLDMRKYWKADAGFLARMSKGSLLAVLAEAGFPDEVGGLDHASKAELVAVMERKLAGCEWLPVALRSPAQTTSEPDNQEDREVA